MKPTLPIKPILATLGAAVLLSGAYRAAYADDDDMPLSQLPPAALAALQARAKGATFNHVKKEVEDGQTSYEAKFLVDGKKQEIAVDAEGKVVGEEVEIPAAEVPPAAMTAIQKSKPGATVSRVVKETDHGVVTFEAYLSHNGENLKVEVTAEGGPVAEEVKGRDEDDEKKGGEKMHGDKQHGEKKHEGGKKGGKDEEDDDEKD